MASDIKRKCMTTYVAFILVVRAWNNICWLLKDEETAV